MDRLFSVGVAEHRKCFARDCDCFGSARGVRHRLLVEQEPRYGNQAAIGKYREAVCLFTHNKTHTLEGFLFSGIYSE